uniref:Uncharacterized protein n=1 Tax=Anguilla anguilla TaxID=7936 RepID=A0A0E9VJQ6_ANGAN
MCLYNNVGSSLSASLYWLSNGNSQCCCPNVFQCLFLCP